jgi:UDP-glucose 4-epimerase
MGRVSLVTGGAGFIGSHLVDALVEAGDQVTVLDDVSTGQRENIAGPLRTGAVQLTVGNVLDRDLVDRMVSEADRVFHLAAVVGVRNVLRALRHSIEVNTQGTANVLESAFRHSRRIVLASSSEVYGRTPTLPMHEDDDRILGSTAVPRWSYSTAKALDEHLALAYHAEGLAVSIVRYFNTYGPRLHYNGYGSVIGSFIRQALAGEPLTIHGDGTQSRCFTYVSDTVRATIAALEHDAALGEVFNVGNPSGLVTINELAARILALVNPNGATIHMSYEEAYDLHFEDAPERLPDVSKAAKLLDWIPRISLDDGLTETSTWSRRHRAPSSRD